MFKPWEKMTPRERLVETARGIYRTGTSTDAAINAAIDGWNNAPATAPIRKMARYFLECSDRAHARLINEVQR